MIKLFVLSLFGILKVYSKEITIKYNDNNWKKLKSVIKDNQNDNELILRFVDNYYLFVFDDLESSMEISIYSNIKFIGNNNGTVFDFDNNFQAFKTEFSRNKGDILKYENIVFKNFKYHTLSEGIGIMYLSSKSDNFTLAFENCTFQDNYNSLLYLDVNNQKVSKNDYSVIINNCKFYNNHERIIVSNYILKDATESYKNHFKIKITNSKFFNNNVLFYAIHGQFDFENCYFQSMDIDSMDDSKALFFFGDSNILTIKDSIFSNINTESEYPLISTKSISTIKITNTTFTNAYTGYSFLISKGKTIIIENSIFNNTSNIFEGKSANYEITNCLFTNMRNKNSLSQIINSYHSKIMISDSVFNNMTLSSSLFNSENLVTMNNVQIKDININSKALLHTTYRSLNITNSKITDIKCTGDSGESSLILFDSGELLQNMVLSNIIIKRCIANGPLVKIMGDTNEIFINDTTIEDNKSYGSIIKNISSKSGLSISDLTYSNNCNNNKYECGNIYLQNDFSLSVSNSSFTSNYSEGDGGIFCFENVLNMELHLNSNEFGKNKARNGGALYFGEEQKTDTSYAYKNKEMVIENNKFYENLAEMFGGAIYTNYNKISLVTIKNNTVINNIAGVMGAGIYTSNPFDNGTINIDGFTFNSNFVDSLLDNYTSKPTYISLNTTLIKNSKKINAGDYYPLIFTLHDEYGHIITDITKHFSMITLKLNIFLKTDITDKVEKDDDKNVYLFGNVCTFVNGYCNFNQLQIYGNPNKYIIEPHVENYQENIQLIYNEIEIIIKDCEENQIVMTNEKFGIQYCEDPICKNDCPVGISAKCNPFYKKKKNDINLNTCECLPGWDGDYCENKVYIDYSSFDNKSAFISLSTIIIICGYIVFIIINRKYGIIKDIGLYKILLCSVGIVLIFISNVYSSNTSSIACVLNFMLKHVGVITLLIMFYFCISLGYELGISVNNNKDEEKYVIMNTFASSFYSSDFEDSKLKNTINIPNKIDKSNNITNNSFYGNIYNNSDINNSSDICSNNEFNYSNDSIENSKKQDLNTKRLSYMNRKRQSSNIEIYPQHEKNRRLSLNIEMQSNISNKKPNSNTEIQFHMNNKKQDSNIEVQTITNNKKQDSNTEIQSSINSKIQDSNSDMLTYVFRKSNDDIIKKKKSVNFLSLLISKSDESLNKMLGLLRNTDELKRTQKEHESKKNQQLKRSIRRAHSLFIELMILYPIFIIITIIIPIIEIFFNNKKIENYIVQSNNREWYYKCFLEPFDIIYSILEELLIIVILIKGIFILKLNCIFKKTYYMLCSAMLQSIFGPFITIITLLFINNQKYQTVVFSTSLNYICYLIIFILLSWDNIYYIIKGEGNNTFNYFRIIKFRKCYAHNSYTCGCPLERTYQDLEPIVHYYIKFYKFCSTTFIVEDKKIKYIKVRSKYDSIFIDNKQNQNQ